MVKIAPSVLALDFTKFSDQMNEINKYADWVHFDVMDGHFVPNLSYGPKILEDIKKASDLFCDVHIMVSNPFEVSKWFIEAKADLITFHIEAVESLDSARELIRLIKAADVQAGISLKPNTDLKEIEPLLADLDLVLIMSVEPGFGGQSFIEDSLNRVERLAQLREDKGYNYLIEIDGGINDKTGQKAKLAGCDVLVAGSYVFNGDIEEKINSLR